MIYDCFSFFNELDLLEIRLNTLDKVVDKFILAESPLTHTGNPKPLYYMENKQRFTKFSNRIIHIIVDDVPEMPDDMPLREQAWTRENWQRNAIIRGLPDDIKGEDILLISDIDEIPDPHYVQKAVANPTGLTRLDLKAYCFFINLRNVSYPIWNNGTCVLTWNTFNNPATYTHAGYSECCLASVNQGPSATRVRFLKPTKILKPAGWHFSYLGGVEAIQRKMKSIAHTEFDTDERTSFEYIRNRLMRGKGFVNSAERFLPEVFNESFPLAITQNQHRYHSLITPVPHGRNPSKLTCSIIRTRAILRDFTISVIAKLTPRCLLPLRHKIYCMLSGTKT